MTSSLNHNSSLTAKLKQIYVTVLVKILQLNPHTQVRLLLTMVHYDLNYTYMRLGRHNQNFLNLLLGPSTVSSTAFSYVVP